MSKIELYFDDEKQREALIKVGYEIKLEKVSYTYNVYHNDVETSEYEAYVVYEKNRTGIKIDYPWGDRDNKYSQVNRIFSEVLASKLIYLCFHHNLEFVLN